MFRFFGFILAVVIRFWFIVIPAVLVLYYYYATQKKKSRFRKNTGLDPNKEIKLTKEPTVEEE